MSTLRDVKIDLITENSNPIINLFNEITEGLLFQKLLNDRGWELTITGPPRMVDLSKMNNYLIK